MPDPPLILPKEILGEIEQNIEDTIDNGGNIRKQLANFSGTVPWDTD